MSRHHGNGSILSDTDLSTTANSKWYRLQNVDRISIQATWTGTASGNFRLQFSDDEGGVQDSPTITNVTDDTGSIATITSGAGSPLRYNVDGISARWVRLQWQRTGGSGTLTSARVTSKGAG